MSDRIDVMNVVGARPQFIKAGPVSSVLADRGISELLVHTGQHYDPLLSDAIFRGVGLRAADINLEIGSGTHGAQTAAMLAGLEEVMLDCKPRVVVTYGDTNSTVAGALAAAKLHLPVAHVEAGLRSFNRLMPEELNRVATDHLSDLLLAPTRTAVTNLEREGLADRTELTGDVMVDMLESVDLEKVELPLWASGEFLVATVHRAENTDDKVRLGALLGALSMLSLPIHLLAHPRLRARAAEYGLSGVLHKGSLLTHDPVSYDVMLALVQRSVGLLTDSGGLQKEAYLLETPCITLRAETEWPETMEDGWNVLVYEAWDQLEPMTRRPRPHKPHLQPFGSGHAAEMAVDELSRFLG